MADVNFAIDLVNTVQERMSHRVRKFGFGDGYEQIAADGVNSRKVEYDITTRPLKVSDANTMRTALDNAAIGDYLLCTLEPYSNIQRRYRLKDSSYVRQYLVQASAARATTQRESYEIFQFTLIEAYAE